MGKYLNDNKKTEMGYNYLKKAYNCDYDTVCKKYILFINKYNYGKYVKDELSVSCYWTNKGDEGLQLLNDILDDPEFINIKDRLLVNKNYFKNRYNLI